MAASFLNQAERDFLSKHVTGATPQTPVGQLRRVYYSTYLGGDNSKATLSELEFRWLNKYIRDNGGTPTDDYSPTLWREVVSVIGKTPSNFLNDNRLTFYTNAS